MNFQIQNPWIKGVSLYTEDFENSWFDVNSWILKIIWPSLYGGQNSWILKVGWIFSNLRDIDPAGTKSVDHIQSRWNKSSDVYLNSYTVISIYHNGYSDLREPLGIESWLNRHRVQWSLDHLEKTSRDSHWIPIQWWLNNRQFEIEKWRVTHDIII
jgi:hypothetical protein